MTTHLFDLTGRTALVTGSTRGLGRAGARVIVHGRDSGRAEAVAESLRGEEIDAGSRAFDLAIKTELNTSLAESPGFDAWLTARTPAGRWGEPSDLEGAVVFLAAPASDFVNGHVLYVDGGLLAVI